MNQLTKFPKIFAIGNNYIRGIFEDEVEVTEKVDGSQYSLGKFDNELKCRSKGKEIVLDAPEKMFIEAVEYSIKIQDRIPNNTQVTVEYLQKPKHNLLKYDKIPKNHMALFSVKSEDEYVSDYDVLKEYAKELDIDVVPLLFYGKVDNPEDIFKLLETESFLGGVKIEGIVAKNYNKGIDIGGHIYRVMCGKYVSEKFKEVQNKEWKTTHTGKGKLEVLIEAFRSEARWDKAIQALKELDQLENDPKDIGKLIKHIQSDIVAEEQEEIKIALWKIFKDQILRKSIVGFPEYYKEKLLENNFVKEIKND